MRRSELQQLAIYKRDQAARFRKLLRAKAAPENRRTVIEYVAGLEREANELEAELAALDAAWGIL